MSFRNPFVIDRPLSDRDLFVGREEAVAQLKRALDAGSRLVCLFGHHRLGKTSFVNQLSLRLYPRWRVLRIDLGRGQVSSEAGLRQAVAQALGIGIEKPQGRKADKAADTWQALQERAGWEPPTLVCLDQMTTSELGSRRGSWRGVLSSMAKGLAGAEGLALLVCIEGHPSSLDDRVLPETAETIVLSPLDADESEELLATPLRGKLALGYEVIRAAYVLTGGDPYLVQLFGFFCYQRYAKLGWVPSNGISHLTEDVLQAAGEHFGERWDNLDDAARLVLATMSEKTGQHGMCTPDDISRLLADHVRCGTGDLEQGLRQLQAYGILEELGGPTYRVASDVMRVWVRRNHPLDATIAASDAYRSKRVKVTSSRRRKKVDWVGLGLWGIALLLVAAIAMVWRSRDVAVVWTHKPTLDVAESPTVVNKTVAPTPESGVAPGYIVFQAKSAPGASWDIYIMRSDGSDPKRLTESEADDTLPSLSPDGRKIVFVTDRDGNREVYVMNRNGSDQTNLSRNAADDWTPAWSPDGSEIAFSSFRDGNWELYVMAADGTNPRRLTAHPAADYGPSWAPSGEQIAFVSNRLGNLDIHLIALADSSVRRLTTDPATDQSPAWSPDGNQIAWETYRDDNMEIYVANVDGSEARNLSQDAYADDHGVAWSPAGDRIAFYSNRDGGWDIYVLDLTSGRRANITLSEMIEQSPFWGK
ncbi:MAG: hypothetical protein ACP5G7_07960 [Anaerolineae bacterium]